MSVWKTKLSNHLSSPKKPHIYLTVPIKSRTYFYIPTNKNQQLNSTILSHQKTQSSKCTKNHSLKKHDCFHLSDNLKKETKEKSRPSFLMWKQPKLMLLINSFLIEMSSICFLIFFIRLLTAEREKQERKMT